MVARLSLGMTPLALLLVVRSEGGSYAVAGAVAAAYSSIVATRRSVRPHVAARDRAGGAAIHRVRARGVAAGGLLHRWTAARRAPRSAQAVRGALRRGRHGRNRDVRVDTGPAGSRDGAAEGREAHVGRRAGGTRRAHNRRARDVHGPRLRRGGGRDARVRGASRLDAETFAWIGTAISTGIAGARRPGAGSSTATASAAPSPAGWRRPRSERLSLRRGAGHLHSFASES